MGNKRILSIVLIVCLFAVVIAAFGGGWGGVRATGSSLQVVGTGYGLGKVDQAAIEATLSGFLTCVNNGENTAPGQNVFTTTVSQTQAVTVENGKFDFSFFFSDEDLGIGTAADAGCPNANWTLDYVHHLLTFTLYEIEGSTAISRTAATFTCVMDPPSVDGEYQCTQQ